jgi:hypothetical protein
MKDIWTNILNGLVSWVSRIAKEVDARPKKYSFAVILTLLVIDLGFIVNHHWGGDFPEHCAVLRELIREPTDPENPIIVSNAPHAFFSPYMVALGFIGHFVNASPTSVLFVVSIFNFFLWFYSLFFFVKIFCNDEKLWTTYFYLLVFHLFLWGPYAWDWSSFFHVKVLHLVLPYPSTFAVSLAFISGYHTSKLRVNNKNAIPRLLLISAINLIILLTHPPTFLLTIALGANSAVRQVIEATKKIGALFIIALSIVIPLISAGIWKYYPFWDLFLSNPPTNLYHLASKSFYNNFIIPIIPSLLGLILISKDKLSLKNYIFSLFVMLSGIFAYGYISNHYGYGRVISFMVLALHLMLAAWFSHTKTFTKKASIVIILLFVISLHHAFFTLRSIYRYRPYAGVSSYADYKVLETFLDNNDVVMTDRFSLYFVPAFGGKVTASLAPPYWIPDNEERLKDIDIFFRPDTDRTTREAIMKNYSVDYILLSRENFSLYDTLTTNLGLKRSKLYENKSFILLRAYDNNSNAH